MIALTTNQRQIRELSKALSGADKKIRRQMAIVTNKTAKKVEKLMAKEVGRQLAAKPRAIKDTIKTVKKAAASESLNRVSATVREKQTARIPLRDFNARQTKAGVTYKISKTAKKRNVIRGAFMVPSLGNHVFARVGPKRLAKKGRYKGQMRQAIDKKYGASPWGVFKKQNLKPVIEAYAKAEQYKQLKERIRFLNLKKAGTI